MPDSNLPILNTEIARATRGRWHWVRLVADLLKVAVLAMIIILPIKYLVAQPFVVEGGSMVPSLQPQDYLIIDEFTYLTTPPHRGDVVVFKYPLDPSLYFIKRLIGLPGDTIDIKKGVVWVKRKHDLRAHALSEPYVAPENVKVEDSTIVLGKNEYFMMGDNRKASFDSRVWGPVPTRNIVGRALTRVLPLSHVEMFPGVFVFSN